MNYSGRKSRVVFRTLPNTEGNPGWYSEGNPGRSPNTEHLVMNPLLGRVGHETQKSLEANQPSKLDDNPSRETSLLFPYHTSIQCSIPRHHVDA
jgi:hypothetical protein